jgi:hypothetical protein
MDIFVHMEPDANGISDQDGIKIRYSFQGSNNKLNKESNQLQITNPLTYFLFHVLEFFVRVPFLYGIAFFVSIKFCKSKRVFYAFPLSSAVSQ